MSVSKIKLSMEKPTIDIDGNLCSPYIYGITYAAKH